MRGCRGQVAEGHVYHVKEFRIRSEGSGKPAKDEVWNYIVGLMFWIDNSIAFAKDGFKRENTKG